MTAVGAVDHASARMAPKGLYLRKGMTFGTWVAVGRRILEISNSSGWWLGDWLVYGQDAYGERYKMALEATSLDYQTLKNYAWVARRFAPSRRRVTLSVQHHAEVASLSDAEQDLWLRRAERLGWSRNELRKRLSDQRHAERADRGEVEVTCRVKVTAAREQRWREAAALCDRSLAEWVIATVDAEAQQVLLAGRRQVSGSGVAGPTMPISVDANSRQPELVAR